MDPLSIARYGMMAAQNQLAASAERVARFGAGDADFDLGRETVEQLQAKQQFSANLQVVRFADQMWQALLETQHR